MGRARADYPNSRDSFITTIEVLVGRGQAQEKFTVHKRDLIHSSPVFKAALESDFKEGVEQKLELLEDEPKTFKNFLLWVYSGQLVANSKENPQYEDIDWRLLTSLYILGDQRQIPQLQNDVMDTLIQLHHRFNYTSVSEVPTVFGELPATSPLRIYYIDKFVAHASVESDSGWFSPEHSDDYPRDFLLELAKALVAHERGAKTSVTNLEANKANYHMSLPQSKA